MNACKGSPAASGKTSQVGLHYEVSRGAAVPALVNYDNQLSEFSGALFLAGAIERVGRRRRGRRMCRPG